MDLGEEAKDPQIIFLSKQTKEPNFLWRTQTLHSCSGKLTE